jgi:glycine/D-amino acid oxidase-like deaminating enzyme
MPSYVDVAINGGGVFGASLAPNLAMRGRRDALRLEAREIGSQTSCQAAGLVPLLCATASLTGMARYRLETFAGDIEHDIQFHQVGSLKRALNKEG